MSTLGDLRWKLARRFFDSEWGEWLLTSDRGLAMFESLGYYIVPDHSYWPMHWVAGLQRFWTGQYLLHAFLLFNDAFKVLLSANLMYERHLPELRRLVPRIEGFSDRDNYFSSSFWMQRTGRPGEA
jgi:hypothetical protein